MAHCIDCYAPFGGAHSQNGDAGIEEPLRHRNSHSASTTIWSAPVQRAAACKGNDFAFVYAGTELDLDGPLKRGIARLLRACLGIDSSKAYREKPPMGSQGIRSGPPSHPELLLFDPLLTVKPIPRQAEHATPGANRPPKDVWAVSEALALVCTIIYHCGRPESTKRGSERSKTF